MLKRNIPTALVVSAVAAVLLALSALLLPVTGKEVSGEGRNEVFLADDQHLTAKMSADDTVHMLGEPFNITLTIQYDSELVDVDVNGLRAAAFRPFDISGNVSIVHRKVEGSVYEYVYSVDLVAAEGIPGREYMMSPVFVGYNVLETGEVRTFNVVPEVSFRIGSYFNGDTEGEIIRPPKDAVADRTISAQIMLGAAGALFLLLAVGVFILGRLGRELIPEKEEVSELDLILNELNRFSDEEWLRSKDLRDRLIELEALFYRAVDHIFGLSPQDINNRRNNVEWDDLLSGLERAYAPAEPEFSHVEDIVTSLKVLINESRRGTNKTPKQGKEGR